MRGIKRRRRRRGVEGSGEGVIGVERIRIKKKRGQGHKCVGQADVRRSNVCHHSGNVERNSIRSLFAIIINNNNTQIK